MKKLLATFSLLIFSFTSHAGHLEEFLDRNNLNLGLCDEGCERALELIEKPVGKVPRDKWKEYMYIRDQLEALVELCYDEGILS